MAAWGALRPGMCVCACMSNGVSTRACEEVVSLLVLGSMEVVSDMLEVAEEESGSTRASPPKAADAVSSVRVSGETTTNCAYL